MSLVSDVEELAAKAEALLKGVQSAEPTLADKLLEAVVQVLLEAGYTAPAEPEEPVQVPVTTG